MQIMEGYFIASMQIMEGYFIQNLLLTSIDPFIQQIDSQNSKNI